MFWGKTIVYIDNSNIYRGGKDTGWLPEYEKLMRFLEKLGGMIWDVHFFAIEETSTERTSTSDFFDYLQKGLGFTLHLFTYGFKSIRCIHCGRFSQLTVEKGLDVGVATQIMKDLHNEAFDTMILMSSNREYVEIMDYVRSTGKKVKLLIWRNTLSQELVDFTNRWSIEVIYLDNYREELEKAYRPPSQADVKEKPIQRPAYSENERYSVTTEEPITAPRYEGRNHTRHDDNDNDKTSDIIPSEDTFFTDTKQSDEGTPLH
jgi:uncharacterized LabA/DUF88 family protein